jgi:hypothetical protein
LKDTWRRHSKGVDLESELRRNRPQPRRDFVSALISEVRGYRGQRSSLRFAFVGGLTAVMLVALASAGGFAQAASAVHAVVSTVTGSGATVNQQSPADDQYKCNSGRGNLSETESGPRSTDSDTLINPHVGDTALGPGDSPTDDCDPGNSGPHNAGGD